MKAPIGYAQSKNGLQGVWPAGFLAATCSLQGYIAQYKNEGQSERCLVTVSLVLCLLAVSSVRLANMSSLVQHMAESAGVSNVV